MERIEVGPFILCTSKEGLEAFEKALMDKVEELGLRKQIEPNNCGEIIMDGYNTPMIDRLVNPKDIGELIL